jgi:hypothetical protein
MIRLSSAIGSMAVSTSIVQMNFNPASAYNTSQSWFTVGMPAIEFLNGGSGTDGHTFITIRHNIHYSPYFG